MNDIDYSDVEAESGWIEYSDFVRLWPCEVLHQERCGNYQGSEYYLLQRADGDMAFFDISFGSCSVCDFLEGVKSNYRRKHESDDWRNGWITHPDAADKVAEYFERKRKQLQWKQPREMLEYLTSDNFKSSLWHEPDTESFVHAVKRNMEDTDEQ